MMTYKDRERQEKENKLKQKLVEYQPNYLQYVKIRKFLKKPLHNNLFDDKEKVYFLFLLLYSLKKLMQGYND